MLLLRLEIIAAAYCSMIFKPYAFSLYSHLCVNVSIWLPINTQYIWTGSTRWLGTIWYAPEDDDRVNSEIHSKAMLKQVWRCTSRWRLSELSDALGGRDRVSLGMHFEAMIEWVWRWTWRPGSSELRDALWTPDRASLEMLLEAEIEWTQRGTGRPWSREFGEALWGPWKSKILEMHFEAVIDVIERVWRCTLRPWSSQFGDAIGHRDWVNSEMHSEAVNWASLDMDFDLEVVDGRCARCWDSTHWLGNSKRWECDEVTSPLKLLWRTGWWQLICWEVCWKLKVHSGVNSALREWMDDRQS